MQKWNESGMRPTLEVGHNHLLDKKKNAVKEAHTPEQAREKFSKHSDAALDHWQKRADAIHWKKDYEGAAKHGRRAQLHQRAAEIAYGIKYRKENQ